MRRRRNPWIGIGFSTWALGIDASSVITLRTLKIAQGGSAGAAEAERMVQEKMATAAELQHLAFTGGLGLTPAAAATKTLAHYRRKVRANRRRLSGY